MQHAMGGKIIVDGFVLRAAVVPDCDRVWSPLEAAGVLRRCDVLKQQGDEGGFDLILTEGVSYISDRIDITAETIELLKQLSESAEETQ